MRVKYNRVSTAAQTGIRFETDNDVYDEVFFDTCSGTIAFKNRTDAKKLVRLIEEGKVKEIVLEELSRIGRNTTDVMNTLAWLDDKRINVVVRNLGLQSRPNGVKNPIWEMISNVMTSLYSLELTNIKERTEAGRHMYVKNGGILGRPQGTNENDKEFLDKESSKKIIRGLKKGWTVRQISNDVKVSTSTVMKVKDKLNKYESL